MSNPHVDELRRLPVPERLEAIEELWESLEDESALFPLSDLERADLDRRVAEDAANQEPGVGWEELRGQLESGDGGAGG